MTNKIQVMVNEHNLPLKDFIEMFPDTNIVWLDNSKFYDSGIYYLKTIKLGQLLFPEGRGLQRRQKMSQSQMFSMKITDINVFLDMPLSSQLLYFTL